MPLACPDEITLRRFLLGHLHVSDADRWESHFVHCAACTERAERCSLDDDLTAAVAARKVFSREEDVVSHLIRRAADLQSQVGTWREDETLAWRLPPPAEPSGSAPCPAAGSVSAQEFDFLAQPQQSDELGRLGEYRVLEVLGAGGMGIVFRAEDPQLQRLVALKVMRPALAASRSAQERFLREARAVAAIEHDHIATIHQVGQDRGLPFLAMQYLRGESLQARLQRTPRLEQREVLRIGREAAEALAAAHARGLIHRDIKPDNLWLEESGRLKVLDFGLVRPLREDADLTETGFVLGTPRYMAPEQAQGRTVDPRCDLFSLGAVLYCMAAGQAPFAGDAVTAVLHAVKHDDPPPAATLRTDLCPELADLIAWLLQKDPDRRPASAEDVVRTIRDIERRLDAPPSSPATEPIAAPPRLPRRRARPAPQRWMKACAATVALGAFFAAWAAGIILKVETPDGVVVVEIESSGQRVPVEVAADRTVELIDATDGQPIRVGVDRQRKQLRLEKAGFQVVLKSFDLESPGGDRIRVRFEPRDVAATPPNSPSPQPWPPGGGYIAAPDLTAVTPLRVEDLDHPGADFAVAQARRWRRAYEPGRFLIQHYGASHSIYPSKLKLTEGAIELDVSFLSAAPSMWTFALSQPGADYRALVGLSNEGFAEVAIEDHGHSTVVRSAPDALPRGAADHRLLSIIRQGRLEVYVNGAAVVEPLPVRNELLPATTGLRFRSERGSSVAIDRFRLYDADRLPPPQKPSPADRPPDG